ncbi:MAG: AZOBR_p60025 family cell surface glycopolymer formation protein, partial [Aggregatilineales bacterium]
MSVQQQKTSLLSRLPAPWFVMTALCVIYITVVVIVAGDVYTLMTIGSWSAPPELMPHVYNRLGYDGQSVFYIARYGLEIEPFVDVPAYRAGRILLPALGNILAFGQVEAIPYTLTFINMLAMAGGTFLLGRLLQGYGISRWFVVGYALSFGVMGAVRLSTTEPLAYGLVIAGIYTWQQKKWLWSAIIFMLAGLTKEPTLLFAATFVLLDFADRRFKRGVLFGAIVIVPFIAWQFVLYNQFGRFGVGSGAGGATGFEIIPLMGFWRILLDGNPVTFATLGTIIGLFVVLPTLWAAWQCGLDGRAAWRQSRNLDSPENPGSRQWDWLSLVLLIQVLVIFTAPFST